MLIVLIQYIAYLIIPCHYILYQYQLQTLILFSKYTKRSRLITIIDYSIYLYLLQQFFWNFFYLPFSRSSLSRRIVLFFLTTKILLSLPISVNSFLRIFGIFFYVCIYNELYSSYFSISLYALRNSTWDINFFSAFGLAKDQITFLSIS